MKPSRDERFAIFASTDGTYTVAPLGYFGKKYVIDRGTKAAYEALIRKKNGICALVILAGAVLVGQTEYYYTTLAIGTVSALIVSSYFLWQVKSLLRVRGRVWDPGVDPHPPQRRVFDSFFGNFVDGLTDWVPPYLAIGFFLFGLLLFSFFIFAVLSALFRGEAMPAPEAWPVVLLLGGFTVLFGFVWMRHRRIKLEK